VEGDKENSHHLERKSEDFLRESRAASRGKGDRYLLRGADSVLFNGRYNRGKTRWGGDCLTRESLSPLEARALGRGGV